MDNTYNEFIDELLQKSDLISIVSKYASVEKRGRYFWCKCPLHGEKTPSFCINEYDNFFYCYGCHVGGTAIQFIMQIESLNFREAVELLADWANMEVPEKISKKDSESIEKSKQRKERLLSLMKETAHRYHDNLSLPSALPGIEYLKKRQLEGNLINRFGLGYSSGLYDLPDFLKSKGYTTEEMLLAGVVKKRETNGSVYDPLANRVIFPIIDIYEHVIAFGGRTLESNPDFAKYLNTAETELFNKRNTLYAINYLKKQRKTGPIPYVIVVEGYMDTISLHKAGFTMAVASMGTALTEHQAKLIKRFADKVYICYDGDSAGQKATIRGLEILKENGLDVYVVQLPDRFDPDDVIKTYGREGYQKCLDEALPLTEFKINYIKSKYDLQSVDSRVKFLNDCIEILSELKDSVERELYIPMVSDISATNIDFIRRELNKKLEGKNVAEDISVTFNKNSTLKNRQTVEEVEEDDVIIYAEKYILYSMIHGKPYAYFKSNAEYLFSSYRKDIYNLIENLKAIKVGHELVKAVYESFEDKSKIADIVNFGAKSGENVENEGKYYKDCVWKVYKNYLSKLQKEYIEDYANEIDNLKKIEIKKKLDDISNKLRNKSVEELWTEKKE